MLNYQYYKCESKRLKRFEKTHPCDIKKIKVLNRYLKFVNTRIKEISEIFQDATDNWMLLPNYWEDLLTEAQEKVIDSQVIFALMKVYEERINKNNKH